MAYDSVYCGFWVNWERDALMGATLTLPKQWGNVLLAFLTLFIRLTGSHLWGVICLAIHQIRATPCDQDCTHHQFQVIFRSGLGESRVLWDILKIGWHRRRTVPRVILRCLPLLVITAVHMLLVAAAGLFCSRSIITDGEALIQSPSCGWLDELSRWTVIGDNMPAEDIAKTLLVMGRSSYRRSSVYARTCYAEQYSDYYSICSTYVQQLINSTIDLSAPCPFASAACDGPAITIDTGFVSSDSYLGVNTLKSDRISVKKVATCAPLLGERYADGWIPVPPNVTDIWGYGTLKGYNFGGGITPVPLPKYMFAISNETIYPCSPPYWIGWANHFVSNQSETDFDPIPDFQSDDADLIIMALFNTAAFTEPVHDPWFKAESAYKDPTNTTFWIANKAITFVGCLERYQMCSQSRCTPLTGLYEINPENFPLSNLTATQAALSQLLWKALWAAQFNYGMRMLNQDVLLAKDFLWSATDARSSAPFGIQWHDEILNLHNISLALLQRRIVEFASPPDFRTGANISSSSHVVPPTTDAGLGLCKQIKIRTNSYISFRVLNLLATIIAGMGIISANIFLPTMAHWIQLRWDMGRYKQKEWTETGALQLQRMACEGRDIWGWIGREGDIPTTEVPGLKFSLTRLSLAGIAPGKEGLP